MSTIESRRGEEDPAGALRAEIEAAMDAIASIPPGGQYLREVLELEDYVLARDDVPEAIRSSMLKLVRAEMCERPRIRRRARLLARGSEWVIQPVDS